MNDRFDLRIITQPHSQVYWGYFRRLVFGNSSTKHNKLTYFSNSMLFCSDVLLPFSHIPRCIHAKTPDFPRLFEPREWTETIQQQVINIYNTIHTTPEEVSGEELNKTIKLLKNNKATGQDQIPNKIFSEADRETKQIYTKTKQNKTNVQHPPHTRGRNNQIIQYKGKGTQWK